MDATVAALMGVAAGAAGAWALLRGRVAQALEQGQALSAAELAQAKERTRSLEEERVRAEKAADTERVELGRLRSELEGAKERLARAEERAAPVPKLTEDLGVATRALEEARERLTRAEERAGQLPKLEEELTEATKELDAMRTQVSDLRASTERLTAELDAASEALETARKAEALVSSLTASKAELETRLQVEQAAAEQRLKDLDAARQTLTDQFKSLATQILDEKTQKFTEQNKQNLDQLLEPLKVQLTEFKGKVEEVYVNEAKDRSALKEQVGLLMGLNKKLSEDANNLTLALKGSSKAQGTWGELILERVLESAGLRKGHEYDVQDSHTREDGSRAQPDVVVRLPEAKNLVVDSKVSLLAYEAMVSAASDEVREAALAKHVDSLRTHIKGLSGKSYQDLYGLSSLDFVVMFVPIEPAFMLAIQGDPKLWQDAWERNVLLVSPSTLLFVVRTVAHLWRQEQQTKNAQDIAKKGADLYDRLAGFVEDLEEVGLKLGKASEAYDSAYKKLSTGRGNVIRQAEMLKELGIKPSKALPKETVAAAMDAPEQLELPSGKKQ